MWHLTQLWAISVFYSIKSTQKQRLTSFSYILLYIMSDIALCKLILLCYNCRYRSKVYNGMTARQWDAYSTTLPQKEYDHSTDTENQMDYWRHHTTVNAISWLSIGYVCIIVTSCECLQKYRILRFYVKLDIDSSFVLMRELQYQFIWRNQMWGKERIHRIYKLIVNTYPSVIQGNIIMSLSWLCIYSYMKRWIIV